MALRADGAGKLVGLVDGIVRKEGALRPRGTSGFFQERPQGDAIDLGPIGRLHPAEVEQCGEQINVRDDGGGEMRLPFCGRPAHEERHARAALMHAGFPAAHPGVVGFHAGGAAIVGEE